LIDAMSLAGLTITAGYGRPRALARHHARPLRRRRRRRLAERDHRAKLARLTLDGGHAIAFGLAAAAASAGRVEGSKVTYPDVWPGVDVRLEVLGAGVEETLVLRSPAPASFVFPLRLTGPRGRMAGGRVGLADAGGTTRAVLPAGTMADAGRSQAGPAGVVYSLERSAAGTALRMALDPGWLTDPARQYPVLVDPSVASGSADSSLVVHGSSSGSGSSELLAGQVDGSPACRSGPRPATRWPGSGKSSLAKWSAAVKRVGSCGEADGGVLQLDSPDAAGEVPAQGRPSRLGSSQAMLITSAHTRSGNWGGRPGRAALPWSLLFAQIWPVSHTLWPAKPAR
jgi:hypothetical protein